MLNRLKIAFKAFAKGWSDPDKTAQFLDGKKEREPKGKKEDRSHLRLLAILQNSSRLIDFFQEDISNYNDTQVGAAVRTIHGETRKILEEMVTIRPVMDLDEGARVDIPAGFDPNKIKVVGNVVGNGPYKGVLIHPGWQAHKLSLPKAPEEQMIEVLSPAEVEV
jgi:hypothetical protein